MVNKKIMLIVALGVILFLVVAIIIFISQRDTRLSVESSEISQSTIKVVPTSGELLPTAKQPSSNQSNQLTPNQETITDPQPIVEHFVWLRVIYYSDNNDSKKLVKYIADQGLGEKLVLDLRDFNDLNSDLAELKTFLTDCKLSGEPLTVLPLAYDREYEKCYVGYYNIISYLNGEIERNKNF